MVMTDHVDEYFELLSKSLFKAVPIIPTNDSGDLDKWISDNGIELNGVQVVYKDGMNRVICTESIKTGEEVIKVPRDAMITASTALGDDDDDDDYSKLNAYVNSSKLINTFPMYKIILFLLVHAGKSQSKWRPYLDRLPRNFTIPFWMDQKIVKQILGQTSAYIEFSRAVKFITRQYQMLSQWVDQLPQELGQCVPKFSFRDYMWAQCILFTRQNAVPSTSPNTASVDSASQDVIALIPIWDMVNHKDGLLSTEYDLQSDCLVSRSNSDYHQGEEYCMCYGNRSNMDLLLYSGFILSQRTSLDLESVKIQVSLTNSKHPLYSQRAELLQLYHLQSPQVLTLHHNLRSPDNAKILVYLNILLGDKESLNRCRNQQLSPLEFDQVQKRFLALTLEKNLREFKAVDDQDLLDSESGKVLIEYRNFERRVIESMLNQLKDKTSTSDIK
ncbi:hypothetical protein MP228_008240 [Amoeboaphelidium protococcarum]|nr:hypothetical protein MP228_008240 [Amoeboaphelidium protococcarum]